VFGGGWREDLNSQRPEGLVMRRETLLQVALVLVSVAFGIQMANTWPVLSAGTGTLESFLLTHAGVAVVFSGLFLRIHRRQSVVPAEVYVLAAVVLASWTADLGMLLMPVAR
jgi:hypothetical protein